MVFGQTSIGDSELDAGIFQSAVRHFLPFQVAYISTFLFSQNHLPMQGICQEMQVVKQTQP